MNENKITIKESQLIQNIINKLNAYMKQNDQTLFSLAQTTGFAYQPLHRLMKGISVPNLSSLAMLSDYLDCSIAELITDEFFIDVDVLHNSNEIPKMHSKVKARIYIPYHDFEPHFNRKFFILQKSDHDVVNPVFYLTNEIIGDGQFIVIRHNQHVLIDVLLSSSKFILIQNAEGREERIPTEKMTVLAKLFKHAVICDQSKDHVKSSPIYRLHK